MKFKRTVRKAGNSKIIAVPKDLLEKKEYEFELLGEIKDSKEEKNAE